MEFLVSLEINRAEDEPAVVLEDLRGRDAMRLRELAEQGHVVRLWMSTENHGEPLVLGLWRAGDVIELHAILRTLPLHGRCRVAVKPLLPHADDPEAGTA
jgi:muconolactone delta-isomerase